MNPELIPKAWGLKRNKTGELNLKGMVRNKAPYRRGVLLLLSSVLIFYDTIYISYISEAWNFKWYETVELISKGVVTNYAAYRKRGAFEGEFLYLL